MVKKTKTFKPEKFLTELKIDPSVLNAEGILSFEELDPTEYKVISSNKDKIQDVKEADLEFQALDEYINEDLEELPQKKKKKKQKKGKSQKEEKIEEVYDDIDMSKWSHLGLHPKIIVSLKKLKFSQPTPIQEAVIPKAMEKKDILASSETGSGKTLW